MQTLFNTLYLYQSVHRVLFADHRFSCYDKDNAPMNRKPIKIHKGTDNEVVFRTLDPNNSPVPLCTYNIYIRLFSGSTQVLERLCIHKPRTGVFSAIFNEGDLMDLEPGFYKAAIVVLDDMQPGSAMPVYTDYSSNVEFTVELTQQMERHPAETFTISDGNWTEVRDSDHSTGYRSKFYSSAIPANRTKNHLNSVHSYSVYAQGYTGRLYVYATLNETPSTDHNGWFLVDSMESSEDYIQFLQFTGVRHFSFVGNYMWVRFVYEPDDTGVITNGEIKQINVRF